MRWTTDGPLKPGFYWARVLGKPPVIIEVRGDSLARSYSFPPDYRQHGHQVEWCGPLEPPPTPWKQPEPCMSGHDWVDHGYLRLREPTTGAPETPVKYPVDICRHCGLMRWRQPCSQEVKSDA